MDNINTAALRKTALRPKGLSVSGIKETAMKTVFLLSALVSVFSVIAICIFLFASGFPAMAEIGIFDFLTGTGWHPLEGEFGILPMIVGSLYVTAGSIIIGVPIGILCAVFMACYCPPKLYKIIKPMINLLAGIPSIVYGFFGLVVIVPVMQTILGGSGKGILTVSILLGVMILPTIIGLTESAIRAVPESCYEGALALGATHERSVFRAVLPAAKSGVFAGVVLGIGRAVGETMAVVMVAGNQIKMPDGITSGVRTLTANIVMEMGYASEGLHRNSLIAAGVVLFVFVLIINLSFSMLKRGGDK